MTDNGNKDWSLRSLYNAFLGDDGRAVTARSVLDQTDWFTSTVDFDPASGQEMPMSLTRFLIRVSCRTVDAPDYPRDRLWRIVEHARLAIQRLIRSLNESPARDHSIVHYSRVREMDTACFVKLMTRPGRNIREKIAVHPLVPSVRRFQSIDLSENRLLKEFLRQLLPLIELRRETLSKRSGATYPESQLEEDIRCWLSSEEAASISAWGNTPPNNTMLSHPDYRRIWDAWGWLQTLDKDIARDCEEIASRRDMVSFWTDYALGWKASPDVNLIEVPLLFNYDKFSVKVWQGFPLLLHHRELEVVDVGDLGDARSVGVESTGSLKQPPSLSSPVCVDLARLLPEYAADGEQSLLPLKMLWQQWEDRGTRTEFCLPMADAIWDKQGNITVSLGDLFCSDSCTTPGDVQERAARAMVQELHQSFLNDVLVWLVPDICGDFETKTLRRNINAVFRRARPLPRSVAAAFERYSHCQMPRPGYRLLVVDEVCGKRFATILSVSQSKKLRETLEETGGYYWERHPAVLLSGDDEFRSVADGLISVLNKDERWIPRREDSQGGVDFDENEIRRYEELMGYDEMIVLDDSPVLGGLRYLELQLKVPGAVLWRDHLPPLSIEVLKDGREHDFYLVRKDTSPLETSRVGQRIRINIPELFFLPIGQSYYSLPLHQGSGRKQLNYNAYLRPNEPMSPNNPYQREIACVLRLHYTYGADDPYELVFEPAPSETFKFSPIKVEWKRAETIGAQVDVRTLPVPQYPPAHKWSDFIHFPRKDNAGFENILDVLSGRLQCMAEPAEDSHPAKTYWRRIDFLKKKRFVGKIISQDRHGYYVVDLGDSNKARFSARDLIEGTAADCKPRSLVYLNVKNIKEEKWKGQYVSCFTQFPDAIGDAIWYEILGEELKGCRFFLFTIWGNGNSIYDSDAPVKFRIQMEKAIVRLAAMVDDDRLPEDLSKEAFFFLSCLHKDALKYTIDYLVQALYSPDDTDFLYYWRPMSMAIGDATDRYQRGLYRLVARCVGELGDEGLKVLSIASWRSAGVVHLLSADEVSRILRQIPLAIQRALSLMQSPISDSEINYLITRDRKLVLDTAVDKIKWKRQLGLTTCLELLLALVRVRENSSEDMREVFSLNGDIVQSLKQIIRIATDYVVDTDWPLYSRVVLKVDKPAGMSKVPDLLYALKLYLTGESASNRISILSIQEDDSDGNG